MISSRTPEGWSNRCPVCGQRLRICPSWPTYDAPCPRCGSLVWFTAAKRPVMAGDMTVQDFRDQLDRLQALGIQNTVQSASGADGLAVGGADPAAELRRVQGMIDSMTAAERRDPDSIGPGRQRRIAAGS